MLREELRQNGPDVSERPHDAETHGPEPKSRLCREHCLDGRSRRERISARDNRIFMSEVPAVVGDDRRIPPEPDHSRPMLLRQLDPSPDGIACPLGVARSEARHHLLRRERETEDAHVNLSPFRRTNDRFMNHEGTQHATRPLEHRATLPGGQRREAGVPVSDVLRIEEMAEECDAPSRAAAPDGDRHRFRDAARLGNSSPTYEVARETHDVAIAQSDDDALDGVAESVELLGLYVCGGLKADGLGRRERWGDADPLLTKEMPGDDVSEEVLLTRHP